MRYEPHAHALLLPPLTDEEYEALKADIATNGVLYPVILDENDRILDGVHRVRIAGELGFDPPVARHEGLTDERKLHLAVGLNLRRRQVDGDCRRAVVRKLRDEHGLSLRKIAAATGWSKSTVERDAKTSPFEALVAEYKTMQTALLKDAKSIDDAELSEAVASFSAGPAMAAKVVGWADGQWLRGSWPPAPEEHLFLTLVLYTIDRTLARVFATFARREVPPEPVDWRPSWKTWSPEKRCEIAERWRELGFLYEPPSQMGQRAS